ncbi:MAG: Hsp20/alpha crystallin family protein [Chloroflexi bacterium]|nr:Hsp20/alpha crystallin family protein [Chloroflexota bacterium]
MFVRSTQLLTITYVRPWRPPTDVYETETDVVVEVEIAGMRDEDFHVSLEGRLLTISGTRADKPRERRAYHEMEIPSGEFRTDLELPVTIDTDAIRAVYEDGFLRIRLQKA